MVLPWELLPLPASRFESPWEGGAPTCSAQSRLWEMG